MQRQLLMDTLAEAVFQSALFLTMDSIQFQTFSLVVNKLGL